MAGSLLDSNQVGSLMIGVNYNAFILLMHISPVIPVNLLVIICIHVLCSFLWTNFEVLNLRRAKHFFFFTLFLFLFLMAYNNKNRDLLTSMYYFQEEFFCSVFS